MWPFHRKQRKPEHIVLDLRELSRPDGMMTVPQEWTVAELMEAYDAAAKEISAFNRFAKRDLVSS